MWIPLLDFTYPNMIPASLVGCAAERPPVSTAPARDVGINLIKDKAGSNPAMRTWAHGGLAFPRLCQRPLSSDIHQMIRRPPVRAVVTGAYHSESGSSIKAIAKPMTIDRTTVDDNWCSVVYNALTTARAGSVSLCFKYHKAQTQRRQAPVVMDAPSGLDPANRAAFSFKEGHTEIKGYSGGIGICQLTGNHTIKTPTGSVTSLEFQLTNYVKGLRRMGSHARS